MTASQSDNKYLTSEGNESQISASVLKMTTQNKVLKSSILNIEYWIPKRGVHNSKPAGTPKPARLREIVIQKAITELHVTEPKSSPWEAVIHIQAGCLISKTGQPKSEHKAPAERSKNFFAFLESS